MKLFALRCGGLLTDLGMLFEGRAIGSRSEIPLMCFAVDTGDGVLVFDTGVHESCCAGSEAASAHYGALIDGFEPVCTSETLIDERLRQAGIAVDDVRWVTNSHLHFDHSGRNDVFRGATQLVRNRELEYARVRTHKPTGYIAGDLTVFGADAEHGAANPWDYDDRFELVPGVALVDAAGHTPGHQGLEVTFPDGKRFVAIGDAAYTLEGVERAVPMGYSADRARATATLERFRDASKTGVVLLSGHDREQWSGVGDVELLHAD